MGSIRLARPEEAPLLPLIEVEAAKLFQTAGMPGIADMSVDDAIPEAYARDRIADGTLWVAADARDAPVGFLALKLTDGLPYIVELDVLPQHGGKGLGRALVGAACAWAKQQGHTAITLSTFRSVPWNAPFYAKLGFVEWPAAEWGIEHFRIWHRQSLHLDMTKRVMMIRRIPG